MILFAIFINNIWKFVYDENFPRSESVFSLARYDILLNFFILNTLILFTISYQHNWKFYYWKELHSLCSVVMTFLLSRYYIMLLFSIMKPMVYFEILYGHYWNFIFWKELHALRSFLITFSAWSLWYYVKCIFFLLGI